MAEIDFSTVLKDLSGTPIKDGNGADLTLGTLISGAALAANSNITQKESWNRFQIAKMGLEGGTKEVSEELLETIRDAVHTRHANTLVFGRVCEIVGPPKGNRPAPRTPPGLNKPVTTRDRSHLVPRKE